MYASLQNNLTYLRNIPAHTIRPADHFAAGAMGLSLSYSAMHPLDTLKTRIQAAAARGQNWHTVFTRETARSLGKGFFVSALGAAGQGGARFSTYEFCKSQLLPTTSWTIPMTALSAVLGDLASSVIKVPREVITAKYVSVSIQEKKKEKILSPLICSTRNVPCIGSRQIIMVDEQRRRQ